MVRVRVVQAGEFGGPEVLVTGVAEEPSAGEGQLVVEVAVTPIDYVQTQFRRGFSPGPPLPEPPYVPGYGVAGHVAEVGRGVSADWIGQRVVARTAGGDGGHAQRAVVNLDAVIRVPDVVGFETAAALLDDGSTALGLFESAEIEPDEWVLVEAAGGGVGSLLVQLASAAGARVVGAARGAKKLEIVAALGAEAVVDYSVTGWEREVRAATGGAGPDVVFDGVGGEIGRAAFTVTARGSRFSVHGAASGVATVISPEEARQRGVTVLGLEQLGGRFQAEARQRAERTLSEAAEGRLHPLIGQTLPLEHAAQAHAAMEARSVTGKTLLLVDS